MYKNILVGFDGSAGSKEALDHAIRLAKQLGSRLTALWVKGSLPHFPETIDEVQTEESAAASFFKKLSKEIHNLSVQYSIELKIEHLSGHAAKTIIDYAKKINADLIVLGSVGHHSGILSGFLGHTADRVSENSPCSVLIIRSAK